MRKYKATSYYRFEIEKVEVIRETPKFVVITDNSWRSMKECREAKRSDGVAYFDTWSEARDHLVAIADREVSAARKRLEGAENRLASVKMMEELSGQSKGGK